MKQLTKIFAITIFASFISMSYAQEARPVEKMEGHKMEMKKRKSRPYDYGQH
ncbi:MAG: hypothetical protein M5T52_23200 [Ignavibacteriaceae bacterium]|nr:hypothetical protein [Ignavibacteriaceae bacterium]